MAHGETGMEEPIGGKPVGERRRRGLKSPRILIAEDDPFTRDILHHVFRAGGFDVEAAPDGQEALRAYYENPFSVILLDLCMPHVSGMEVLRTVRGEDRRTPILILTARNDSDTARLAYDLGANAYLAKPYDLRALVDLVRAKTA